MQWAKCQARAERYEEEVLLTVEEMGRTLQYFEWKRDWWLSLVPDRSDMLGESSMSGGFSLSSKLNEFLSADIQSGLRAYAYRQSQTYNDLTVSFVSHWRKYLLAHSLGAAWLVKYPPSADSIPTRPSCGHWKSEAGSQPSTKAKAPTKPITMKSLVIHDFDTDAPLESESNDDYTLGESDAEVNAEEMFVED